MKCVKIHPFGLDEKEFDDGFQPNLLDFVSDRFKIKKKMTDSDVSALKKIAKCQMQIWLKMRTRYWPKDPLILR